MVSTIIKPEGTNRMGEFSHTNEFVYFVMFGSSKVRGNYDDMSGRASSARRSLSNGKLLAKGKHYTRDARPNQFYAIIVDPIAGCIKEVGDPLPPAANRHDVDVPEGAATQYSH